ncbi:unnamed protein product, partial [Porites lobata]
GIQIPVDCLHGGDIFGSVRSFIKDLSSLAEIQEMEFKFLMIVIMAAMCPFRNEASSTTCPRWNNKILAPEATPPVDKAGWYHLAGYSSSSSVLVFYASYFSSYKWPYCVFANRELRLWYGEDLRAPDSESDNGGTTCADVHGQPA